MSDPSGKPAASELVGGLIGRFDEADSNHVRETLEASESPDQAYAALGELGEYMSAVIDPGIVIDFSSFQASLTPDAPTRFHGREGWIEMWRLWLEAWEDYEPQSELEQLSEERLVGMHNFLDREEAVAAAREGLA